MTAFVFSMISQTDSHAMAITKRHFGETLGISNTSNPANIIPWATWVRLYGSIKSCEVSELHASFVKRNFEQVHAHKRPCRRNSITVPIRINPTATTGPKYFLRCTDLVGGVTTGGSTERVQAFSQAALAASERWGVAQGEATRFRFPQLLEEIEEIGRLVSLEHHHKLLIVEPE